MAKCAKRISMARWGKVVLTEVLREDLPMIWQWENDSELSYYLSADPNRSKPLEDVIQRYERCSTDESTGLFLIGLSEDEPIGMMGFDRLSRQLRSCRVFIGIGEKRYWGKGYGTDAMCAFLSYLFWEVGLERVELSVYAFNHRAIASYKKCGYRTDQVRKNMAWVNGLWCDSYEMSITPGDFVAAIEGSDSPLSPQFPGWGASLGR